MKYAWASIIKSCTNFGNYLIEDSLKKILAEKGLKKEPSYVFDAFVPEGDKVADIINELDFLIVPGCTSLTVKHYPGIKPILPKVKIPIYNIGAAFFGEPDYDSLEYLKYFFQPIGTRDPVSNDFLQKNGYKSVFIGCPTLFSGSAQAFSKSKSDKIVFVLALHEREKQVLLLEKLVKAGFEVSTVIQEKHQAGLVRDLGVKIIEYSPENIISEVASAKLTITGRLHVALPSLANGTPVLFIKTFEDSRFSLLDYLGIKSYTLEQVSPDRIDEIIDLLRKDGNEIFAKIASLKKEFSSYVELVLLDIEKLTKVKS